MATPQTARHAIALSEIDVPANVRELDQEHVDALAGSITLQGVLVPVVVRPAGNRFELVAGFHRFAAAEKAGLTEVPADVRDAETEHTDRAVENIASCRRRHDAINADPDGMPTSPVSRERCAVLRRDDVGITVLSSKSADFEGWLGPCGYGAAVDWRDARFPR